MIECEECHSWLHNKCAHVPSSVPPDYPFICPFCVRNTSLQVKSLRHELSQISKSVQSLEQSINTSIPHPVKAQFDSVLSGLHLISSKLSQLSTSLSQTPPANPPSQSSPPHPLTDYPPNPPSPPRPSPVSLSNPPPHSLSPQNLSLLPHSTLLKNKNKTLFYLKAALLANPPASVHSSQLHCSQT